MFNPRLKSLLYFSRDAVVKRKGQGLEFSVTIKDLIESGAHFGHQTRRWNPKMRVYIFGERNNIHIIDLAKTLQQLRVACNIVQEMVSNRKSILFVGTKKAAKAIVREEAERIGEFYVCERWLGGTLTNLSTIRQSIKKLERIEKRIAAGGDGLTKKEISLLSKSQEKLDKNLSGVRGMRKLPGLIVIVDPGQESLAVAEARKLGIPVLALVDTNCDPDPIDYVVPCNDDAQRSVKLILQTIADAIVSKKNEMQLIEGKEEGAGRRLEEVDEMAKAFAKVVVPEGKD
jgi:small subunit ribosomal protein S2